MPRHVDRAERERAILEAAERVFARRGYEATKMTDVASEAGLGKATLYDSFADKESLFFAVLDRMVAAHMRAVHGRLGEVKGGAVARLAALIRAAAEDLDRAPAQAALWIELWAASVRPDLSPAFQAHQRVVLHGFRALVGEILREGQRSGEIRPELGPDALAAAVVSSLEGMLLQRHLEPALDIRAVADALADALTGGLR